MKTETVHQRYRSGYREILRVSVPLMATTASTMVMEFTDRVFLASHSVEAISAALPAGIAAFLFIAFFTGIVGCVSVFVAQYEGAGRPDQVGPMLWQAVWLALAAGGGHRSDRFCRRGPVRIRRAP